MHDLLQRLHALSPKQFQLDSRQVSEGDVFVCRQGTQQDSHEFADCAVKQGAIGIIANRPLSVTVPCFITPNFTTSVAVIDQYLEHPGDALRQIGITGTNGKTTVAFGLHHLLNDNNTSSYSGTLGTLTQGDWTQQLNTTPDSLTLLNRFKRYQNLGLTHHVMEVSSHALAQDRVDSIRYDLALFTNITEDHLDYHLSVDAYQQAKLRLIEKLKPSGKVIYNLDDDSHIVINARCRARFDTFSYSRQNPKADLFGEVVNLSAQGSEVVFHYQDQQQHCTLNLPFLHNVDNALAMASAALMEGATLVEVANKLQTLPRVPGRSECYQQQGKSIIVDYAHNQASVASLLRQCQQIKNGKLHTIIGVTGDRIADAAGIGRTVRELSDEVTFTTDNPLGVPVSRTFAELDPDALCHRQTDRELAIQRAIKKMKSGDLLVICGKGEEQHQYLSSDKSKPTPYRGDITIVKSCLSELA